MTGRADWALELQLERTEKEAVDAEVKEAIAAVLRHMRGGRGRQRKGGQGLVKRLEVARLRASEESEWQIVRLLQDALDYTTGRTLKPEFEERFLLFQDSARDEANRHYISRSFDIMFRYIKDKGRQILDEHGEITASELLEHLISLSDDGRFLDAPEDRPGRYRIVRGRAETALWLERVFRNRIDVESPTDAAHRLVKSPESLAALVNDEEGQALLEAAKLKRRVGSLVKIRKITEDPSATEQDIQSLLEAQSWIFGGRFIGTAARRRLVPGDEIDIPLVRADGSLHVVELKRAMGAHGIVKRHRNAWVPTSEVHDAVGQAINYLVGLDENRQLIRDEIGIETRRASALVLIGHPARHPEVREEEVNEALRTFNSHMSRVEVLTYKELLDSAERALEPVDVDRLG